MKNYYHSVDCVNRAYSADVDVSDVSDTVQNILHLGTEINGLLAAFIEIGRENGIVRKDIVPMLTVYV